MKHKFQIGQTAVICTDIQPDFKQGMSVSILGWKAATQAMPYYLVRAQNGKTAWVTEKNLSLPMEVIK